MNTHMLQRMKNDGGGYLEAINRCCTYHSPIQTAVLRGGHAEWLLHWLSTDVNTQHTLSLCGPLDAEALWHFGSISAIQSTKHPTSLNSSLCLYFIPTVGCFPSCCGWLSTNSTPPPPPSPSTSQAEHAIWQLPQTWSAAAEVLWCARLGPRGCICTTQQWLSI